MGEKMYFEDLTEKVYKAVKELIIQGVYKPGDKLKQEELAQRLGLSRTPLLAAFSRLSRELLIQQIPRRGAVVRQITAKELADIYRIRTRLEPLGALEAAAKITEPGKKRLQDQLASYKNTIESGDSQEIRKADYQFHQTIMNLSGNELLSSILESYNLVFAANQLGIVKPPVESLAEHEKLVQAISQGNQQTAERLMAEHLHMGLRLAEQQSLREGTRT